MLFGKDKRLSALFERLGIAGEDGFASANGRRGEMSNFDRDRGACPEPDQVQRIRKWESFIEIVDAPDEAAFGITPGAEVGYVQVSDSEDHRSFTRLGTKLRKKLHPAIERRAEERKRILRHH